MCETRVGRGFWTGDDRSAGITPHERMKQKALRLRTTRALLILPSRNKASISLVYYGIVVNSCKCNGEQPRQQLAINGSSQLAFASDLGENCGVAMRTHYFRNSKTASRRRTRASTVGFGLTRHMQATPSEEFVVVNVNVLW